MNRWIGRLGLGSTLALAMFGCAQQRAPIDRVQANGLAKSFFLGASLTDPSDDPVFYSRGFVVGSTVVQETLTPGLYTGMDRIRWEVTENMLIARKAYQQAIGADNKGLPLTNPVAATHDANGNLVVDPSSGQANPNSTPPKPAFQPVANANRHW